jgi:hypothetical protein
MKDEVFLAHGRNVSPTIGSRLASEGWFGWVFREPGWLKTQKRLTAWFVGVPGRASEISEESPRPEPKESDSRVPERDVKHANHRNAHSREVTVRSGAGRSRGCVQCPVRLRDRESNLVTREGWCKRQERSPQWPSPKARDLKRGLDDEPTCPAFGHAGFPCWWSPPPESNRRPHPYHGSAAKRRAIRRLPARARP